MPTKDDDSPGLLAKMAKLVRPAAGAPADGDAAERESYSKQALKEMIERKRRNDFVRRREFDQLRKLRRRETVPDTGGGRPSFFSSSIPSKPESREGTLKKIDEIEAQMSMQWWKNKAGTALPPPMAPVPPAMAAGEPLPTVPADIYTPGPDGTAQVPLEALSTQARAYAPTAPGSLADLPPAAAAPAPTLAARAAAPQPQRPLPPPAAAAVPKAPLLDDQLLDFTPTPGVGGVKHGGGPQRFQPSGGFSASKVMSFHDPDFEHDPVLEEAAIHFANGDAAGTEAALREALAAGGSNDTWMALFDLYRATGNQDAFDSVALDFAGRFGRSAPVWFSLAEGQPVVAVAASVASAQAGRGFQWRAPSTIGVQTVATLLATLTKAAEPWQLDWSPLKQIEPEAAPRLAEAFAHWAARPVKLHFTGAQHLEDVLGAQTPSGDAAVPQAWWQLRMAVLQVMGRSDEFELVALDYCVTYEVSPPSWQAPRCTCTVLSDSAPSDVAPLLDAYVTTGLGNPSSEMMSTQPLGMMPSGDSAALSGVIEGDAGPALAPFQLFMKPGDALSIDCSRLARMDFSAAGSVLNWAAEREAEGCRIQFRELHRLVAIFFNVIGINEHARVTARKN